MAKAFDKVWHEGIKYKIHIQYRLPQLTIKLLFTFLQQRTDRIKVNDGVGSAFDLKSGISQGYYDQNSTLSIPMIFQNLNLTISPQCWLMTLLRSS